MNNRGLRILIILVSLLSIAGCAATRSTKTVNWASDYVNGRETARKYGKPMMLYFITSKCPECKQVTMSVFYDPDIAGALEDFVNIYINIDDNKKLRSRFGVRDVPAIVFLDQRGRKIVESERWNEKDAFLEEIRDIASRYGR